MPSLRELQRGFAAAMHGRADGIVAAIDGGALGAGARVGIYRNAIAATRLRTLSDSYPAVRALVGDAFFERLAYRYSDLNPSRSGDLCVYGAGFPQFIEQSPEAIEPVPYLADIARLEWLRQEAALAADADSVPDPMPRLPAAADPGRLRATLHPSLRSIRSAFPVFAIHRWCDAPAEPAPRLDDGAECGLIWRSDGEVAESAIHPASYAFVEALREGGTLADAAAAGEAQDDGFQLRDCLDGLLDRGLIVDFTPEAGSS